MPNRTVDSDTGSIQVVVDRQPLTVYSSPPQDTLVQQLVAAQAAAFPDHAAVVAEDHVLTYSTLNERANQFGNFLRSLGVGPDTLVGLCLDSSAALILAELGILKSGGAYLPLDPTYPEGRLAFILKDAQPEVLVTEARLARRLPVGKWRTIKIDTDALQIEQYSVMSTSNDVGAQNLAYVIYTSGSTGRPKGVQITHANLLNLIFWHQQAFEVSSSDRASQIASPGFDAAVWETWPYLATGASLHLAKGAIRGEPVALRNWLVRERITIGFVPTALAEQMIALDWPRESALRIMLTGADTLHFYPPPSLPFVLVNNYGPTECTVVATSCAVQPSAHDGTPPIGRPISNVNIHILDERLRQVPVGQPGEICIAGAGVGRGYLNSPELSAAKFIDNPFQAGPNDRCLYRTGDVGRCLPDGQIQFLGRIDEQIKIRGYRVEPNEVVAALNTHPAVRASAVVAREHTGIDKHLIAYVVLAPGSQLTASALQNFLRQELPEYMIPRVFVRLEFLPLTPNGKIDRASLPAPDIKNTMANDDLVAPRTVIQQRLVSMLAQLLNLESIGINDNFFLRGGHSLLAAQLIGSIRDTFGAELPLRTIFDSPTAARLAGDIEKWLLAKINSFTSEELRTALAKIETQGELSCAPRRLP
jgi:amino acid adenylation domain-containing protein